MDAICYMLYALYFTKAIRSGARGRFSCVGLFQRSLLDALKIGVLFEFRACSRRRRRCLDRSSSSCSPRFFM